MQTILVALKITDKQTFKIVSTSFNISEDEPIFQPFHLNICWKIPDSTGNSDTASQHDRFRCWMFSNWNVVTRMTSIWNVITAFDRCKNWQNYCEIIQLILKTLRKSLILIFVFVKKILNGFFTSTVRVLFILYFVTLSCGKCFFKNSSS